MRHLPVIAIAAATFLMTWLGAWGALFDPQRHWMLAVLLGFGLTAWTLRKPQSEGSAPPPWEWLIFLWAAVILGELIVHWDARRYTLQGVQLMLAAVLTFSLALDVASTRPAAVDRLIDGLLIGSLPVIFIALEERFRTGERASSLLGNANILGAFLAMIVPLAILRAVGTRGVRRGCFSVVVAVAVAALIASRSRGAMLGVAFGSVALAGRPRWLCVGAAAMLLAVVSSPWTSPPRMELYRAAAADFAAHPIFGTGLWTFRKVISEDVTTHMHAHNLFLHAAAEQGLLGLAALMATLFAYGRAVVRRWTPSHAGPVAATSAVLFQQMVDVTLIFPAIALPFAALLGAAVGQPSGDLATTVSRFRRWSLLAGGTALVVARLALGPMPSEFFQQTWNP